MPSPSRSPSPNNGYMRRYTGNGSHPRTISSEDLDDANGQDANPPHKSRKASDDGPFVRCGKYLTRYVHPFISVDRLVDVVQEQMYPNTQGIYTSDKSADRYTRYWAKALAFSAKLRMHVTQASDSKLEDVRQGLLLGIRNCRANDAYRLRVTTLQIISQPGVDLCLSADTKSDRGFANDTLGRLLIPIHHISEYDKDPVGVRAKVNAGAEGYLVTAEYAPAFLYEDPASYNPDDVLSGFMRGQFLARCVRSIFTGPRTIVNGLGPSERPSKKCIVQSLRIETVNVPMIIYVAIQARYTLTSQRVWSGRDGAFDYEDFAENLFKLFQQDAEWAAQTVRWWNKELFGSENGSISLRVNPVKPSNGFLAKATVQAARRRAAARAAVTLPRKYFIVLWCRVLTDPNRIVNTTGPGRRVKSTQHAATKPQPAAAQPQPAAAQSQPTTLQPQATAAQPQPEPPTPQPQPATAEPEIPTPYPE